MVTGPAHVHSDYHAMSMETLTQICASTKSTNTEILTWQLKKVLVIHGHLNQQAYTYFCE
jgi:hypothetical protein